MIQLENSFPVFLVNLLLRNPETYLEIWYVCFLHVNEVLDT